MGDAASFYTVPVGSVPVLLIGPVVVGPVVIPVVGLGCDPLGLTSLAVSTLSVSFSFSSTPEAFSSPARSTSKCLGNVTGANGDAPGAAPGVEGIFIAPCYSAGTLTVNTMDGNRDPGPDDADPVAVPFFSKGRLIAAIDKTPWTVPAPTPLVAPCTVIGI